MAQVLTPSPNDTPFGSQSLSRTTSQNSLVLRQANPTTSISTQVATFHTASTNSTTGREAQSPDDSRPAASIPSSAPSSPRPLHRDYASSSHSLLSTPTSSLSLDEQYPPFPEKEIEGLSLSDHDTETLDSSPGVERSKAVPMDNATWERDDEMTGVSLDEMPEVPLKPNRSFISMGDDTAIKKEPARHVDYLSHSWREEDIWCSWRHIVRSRGALDNGERLENASWRTWAKTQQRLKTVSPDKLNW